MKLAKALKKSRDRHSKCSHLEGCKPGARLEHGVFSMYAVNADDHERIRVTPLLPATTASRPAKPCEIAWMTKSRRWYPI